MNDQDDSSIHMYFNLIKLMQTDYTKFQIALNLYYTQEDPQFK